MKKAFIFILLAAALISCEGKRGRDGRDGLVSVWKTIELPVAAKDWQPVLSNSGYIDCYIAVFNNIPEITNNIYKDGLVLCYIDYGDCKQILPTVIPNYYEEGDIFDTWTQTIDFIYWAGGVQINLTNDDFEYGEQTPKSMRFVLQILY